jgi:hypothetical protein
MHGTKREIARTIALLSIWFVAFLVLWFVWEMSGRDYRWWTTAISAGVVFVASFVSIKISLPTLSSGTAAQKPNRPPETSS